MARAGLKLSVRQVAEAADVSPNTVTRAEADLPVNTSTLAVLRRALEAKGARFGSDGSVVAHAIDPKVADPVDTRAEARAAAKATADAAEAAAADDSLWQDEPKVARERQA